MDGGEKGRMIFFLPPVSKSVAGGADCLNCPKMGYQMDILLEILSILTALTALTDFGVFLNLSLTSVMSALTVFDNLSYFVT